MQISMTLCKRRLATLWLISSGLLFAILLFQSVFGRYGEKADEAWGWLLPSIMPTLSLIISVLTMDILGKTKDAQVDKFMFTISFYLSIAYLFVVSLMILLQPLTTIPPLELMKQSQLWLGPFQGLVSASLGAFFIKK